MSDRFTVKNVFVTNLDSDNFLEFSQLLDWNVHHLELPVRIFASIYTNCRSPLLFANNNNNEGVHFMEKTRFHVVCKMSRLYMNFDVSFVWNYKGSSYADSWG